VVVKKIGSAQELAYNRLKGVEMDGNKILVVNLAGNFLRLEIRALIWDANYRAVNSMVKPYGVPAMDRCSTSGLVKG
jgi:hypothetical protein